MDPLPPTIVRRVVLAPLALVLSLVLLVLSPLLLIAAFVADLFLPGNWRTVRLVTFCAGYLALEIAGLVAMFTLWIASGFGVWLHTKRMQDAHYGFMAWWLATIDRSARRLFHLRVRIAGRPEPRPGEILVFCRHAGPGNSLLLIGTLLVGYHRHPRIVMLAKLQWEPLYDVMLNRIPNRFIRHDPSRRELYLHAIGDLAASLDDMDAFVLFPEGKGFTPRVRTRAIEYLRSKGHSVAAARAEKMTYVLPPRHGGVMAAINSAPNADVVFVAHSVLEEIGSFRDLWSRIPFARPIVARYWRVPPAEVPKTQDALIEWLYGWWERIDAWIAEQVAIENAHPASAEP
ncbi:MAG: 1-acyl-sn-glycerol-3-phosphate acyltransferase [Actinomycetota bacterium]